jgi:hypothetical protein
VTAATVPVPQPMALDGVVFSDPATRTLTVRLSDSTNGYGRLLWKQGWQLLRQAQESGYRSRVPVVWAHGAGRREIAHGQPADGGALTFTFHTGNDAYSALVSKPGLVGIVTVDRGTHHILGCKFLNRGA